STKQTPTMASDGGQSTASYEVGSSLALTPMSVLTRASAQGGLTVSNASPVTFAMSGYSTATTTVGSSVNLALVADVYGANAQIISTTTLGTFDSPMHIALDAANNRLYWVQSGKLYGMDSGSGRTTFGANATSTVIGSSLYGVGIDSVNNKLYLADSTGGRIWQVDSGGGGTVFGANSISTSTTAVGSFCVPWDVAVDPTNNMLYVADACNARIVRMNSGSGGTTFGANATSSAVGSWRGIAVDAVNKKVYGAVYSTGILMSVDSGSGGTVFGANATTTNPSLCSPIAYSVDNINNKLYIGNSCTGNLVRVDSGGGGTTFGANKITITGSKTGAFGYIYGIAVDNVSSIVYISDYGYWKMQRFSSGFGSSYSTTGAYTSGAVDMGANTTSWGNLSWVSSGSGTITTKARSSATSDFSGATAWGSCTSLSSGQSLYTGNCVTTGHRYIQFQATLSTSGTSVTPSLDSVNIGYTY
ncbi:MAG: hypothetical protein WCO21_01000, partial [bacterium]